jgi:D-glycerate 3-kinase
LSEDWLEAFLKAEALPAAFRHTVERVCVPLAERAARLRKARRGTVVIGLCGAQGSGKSTIAAAARRLIEDRGLTVASMSLDDFYHPREVRERLAGQIHPLLATRGPPGTHEVTLACAIIDRLGRPGEAALPRFDKARDTRRPAAEWEIVTGPVDVVLFEGWCVGARPQALSALLEPVNDLERDHDLDASWRTFVNDALLGPYQALFARLDELVMLQAPSFEVVLAWRGEQERKLRERLERDGVEGADPMSDAEVARFIAHYERLTRHILAEMPARAHWVVPLGADRTPFPER